MHWKIYIPFLSLIAAYLSSLRMFRLDSEPVFRHFSYFLLFVLAGEAFGICWFKFIYKYTSFTANNQWFYVIFHFVIILFYLNFFYLLSTNKASKKGVIAATLLFVALAFTDYIFLNGPYKLNNYSDMLGGMLMVYFSISYYRQLLLKPDFVPLRNDTGFWLSTGILIYHLGSFLGNFLINIMKGVSDTGARKILMIIWLAAILMNVTFTIGFLCRKKT